MNLKIVTYNIQFSLQRENIIKNINLLSKEGVLVFCLQEVVRLPNQEFIVDLILKKLGPEWDAIYHLGEEVSRSGMGNCIIWNKKNLNFKEVKNITLPRKEKINYHEWLFTK